MKQIDLYRRLGDCVRGYIEIGIIPVKSIVGIAYLDCVKGGCDLKEPAFGKGERRKTVRPARAMQQTNDKITLPRTCLHCQVGGMSCSWNYGDKNCIKANSVA